MKQKLCRQLTYWLGVAAIGLIVGLGIQFVQAWTEPQSAPPGGNVGAPINVSNIGQSKKGNLILNAGESGQPIAANGLIVANGKVGIGTLSPNATLDVIGSIKAVSLATTGNAGVVGDLIVNGNVGIGTLSPQDKLDLGMTGKIVNVKDPTAAQDAATKAYVDAQAGGGGVTGGCTLANGIIDTTLAPWGSGCKSTGTVVAYCKNAATSGYACGVSGMISSGGTYFFCICVKE